MPLGNSVGARIRQRRTDQRIKQADLAAKIGISASYLNLIEHDRRRIGGKILGKIALALGVETALLSEGAESALIDQLRNAAAAQPSDANDPADFGRAEDFAARFPAWAQLVADLAQRSTKLESQVAGLTDRLAHDPKLATSLHAVISAVTSIRATSSILVSADDIDAEWQGRFHRNIYEDSQRLADASRDLTRFLDAPEDLGAVALSPTDEAEAFLAGMGFHIPALEGERSAVDPETVAAGASGLRSRAAVRVLADHLHRYRADAIALPLDRFDAAARAVHYDPAALAQSFGAPMEQVLRRLACLPDHSGHPPIGLAICDGAGAFRLLKEVAGFSLPRGGTACSLWPIFQALSQPGTAIRCAVALPGEPQRRFLCYAIATATGAVDFDMPPVLGAVMVVLPDPQISSSAISPVPNPVPSPMPSPVPSPVPGPLRAVGTACRICPRTACLARREPSILHSEG